MKSYRMNAKVLLMIYVIAIAVSLIPAKWVMAAGLEGDAPVPDGCAELVISNITTGGAKALAEVIEKAEGVESVAFSNGNDSLAHYMLTFAYRQDDERALAALNGVEELLCDYDIYVSTGMGDTGSSENTKPLTVMIVMGVISLFAMLPQLGTVLCGVLDGILHMGIIPGSIFLGDNILCVRSVTYMFLSGLFITAVMMARYRKMSRSP